MKAAIAKSVLEWVGSLPIERTYRGKRLQSLAQIDSSFLTDISHHVLSSVYSDIKDIDGVRMMATKSHLLSSGSLQDILTCFSLVTPFPVTLDKTLIFAERGHLDSTLTILTYLHKIYYRHYDDIVRDGPQNTNSQKNGQKRISAAPSSFSSPMNVVSPPAGQLPEGPAGTIVEPSRRSVAARFSQKQLFSQSFTPLAPASPPPPPLPNQQQQKQRLAIKQLDKSMEVKNLSMGELLNWCDENDAIINPNSSHLPPSRKSPPSSIPNSGGTDVSSLAKAAAGLSPIERIRSSDHHSFVLRRPPPPPPHYHGDDGDDILPSPVPVPIAPPELFMRRHNSVESDSHIVGSERRPILSFSPTPSSPPLVDLLLGQQRNQLQEEEELEPQRGEQALGRKKKMMEKKKKKKKNERKEKNTGNTSTARWKEVCTKADPTKNRRERKKKLDPPELAPRHHSEEVHIGGAATSERPSLSTTRTRTTTTTTTTTAKSIHNVRKAPSHQERGSQRGGFDASYYRNYVVRKFGQHSNECSGDSGDMGPFEVVLPSSSSKHKENSSISSPRQSSVSADWKSPPSRTNGGDVVVGQLQGRAFSGGAAEKKRLGSRANSLYYKFSGSPSSSTSTLSKATKRRTAAATSRRQSSSTVMSAWGPRPRPNLSSSFKTQPGDYLSSSSSASSKSKLPDAKEIGGRASSKDESKYKVGRYHFAGGEEDNLLAETTTKMIRGVHSSPPPNFLLPSNKETLYPPSHGMITSKNVNETTTTITPRRHTTAERKRRRTSEWHEDVALDAASILNWLDSLGVRGMRNYYKKDVPVDYPSNLRATGHHKSPPRGKRPARAWNVMNFRRDFQKGLLLAEAIFLAEGVAVKPLTKKPKSLRERTENFASALKTLLEARQTRGLEIRTTHIHSPGLLATGKPQLTWGLLCDLYHAYAPLRTMLRSGEGLPQNHQQSPRQYERSHLSGGRGISLKQSVKKTKNTKKKQKKEIIKTGNTTRRKSSDYDDKYATGAVGRWRREKEESVGQQASVSSPPNASYTLLKKRKEGAGKEQQSQDSRSAEKFVVPYGELLGFTPHNLHAEANQDTSTVVKNSHRGMRIPSNNDDVTEEEERAKEFLLTLNLPLPLPSRNIGILQNPLRNGQIFQRMAAILEGHQHPYLVPSCVETTTTTKMPPAPSTLQEARSVLESALSAFSDSATVFAYEEELEETFARLRSSSPRRTSEGGRGYIRMLKDREEEIAGEVLKGNGVVIWRIIGFLSDVYTRYSSPSFERWIFSQETARRESWEENVFNWVLQMPIRVPSYTSMFAHRDKPIKDAIRSIESLIHHVSYGVLLSRIINLLPLREGEGGRAEDQQASRRRKGPTSADDPHPHRQGSRRGSIQHGSSSGRISSSSTSSSSGSSGNRTVIIKGIILNPKTIETRRQNIRKCLEPLRAVPGLATTHLDKADDLLACSRPACMGLLRDLYRFEMSLPPLAAMDDNKASMAAPLRRRKKTGRGRGFEEPEKQHRPSSSSSSVNKRDFFHRTSIQGENDQAERGNDKWDRQEKSDATQEDIDEALALFDETTERSFREEEASKASTGAAAAAPSRQQQLSVRRRLPSTLDLRSPRGDKKTTTHATDVVLSWLRSLKLPAISKYLNRFSPGRLGAFSRFDIARMCADGFVLCILAKRVARGELSGIKEKAQRRAEKLNNVNMALETFGTNKAMPVSYLWSSRELISGQHPDVTVGLLQQIQRTFDPTWTYRRYEASI